MRFFDFSDFEFNKSQRVIQVQLKIYIPMERSRLPLSNGAWI